MLVLARKSQESVMIGAAAHEDFMRIMSWLAMLASFVAGVMAAAVYS